MTHPHHDTLSRLSVSTVATRPARPFTPAEVMLLREAASSLIPPTAELPAGGDVSDFERRAATAATILLPHSREIERGLLLLAEKGTDLDTLRDIDSEEPAVFYWLSTLLVGVYAYSPEVISATGYPTPHRNVPSAEQAADELSGGILDPVLDRGPCFVDPAAAN